MKTMMINKITELKEKSNTAFLIDNIQILKDFGFSTDEIEYIKLKQSQKKTFISINRYTYKQWVVIIDKSAKLNVEKERLRNEGAYLWKDLKDDKASTTCVFDLIDNTSYTLAFTEGLIYSSYNFSKYKTTEKENQSKLDSVDVVSPSISQNDLDELNMLLKAVEVTRDLVNETPVYLSAEQLAIEAKNCSEEYGFSIKTLQKKEIEDLKMGGLLTVNKGSVNPPTFSILEWKPKNAINKEPYVLVGKGIVYDTGGINLKTMPGSLDDMKCDMGGAAAVIGTLSAISANKLHIHVIGLVPATDNRPGFNAYVPGDVITMHSGQTVEVMNTDAEGRLILADALHYAKQYQPKLTIDLATLTGSALMAIGPYGTVAMGTADDETQQLLSNCGYDSGEKIAWLPFWDDYNDLIKSEVADMKNIGGREAGSITAGKFLSRFVDYDWIHLDIAGPAFLNKPIGYRQTGATGVGVRLLYSFFKSLCQ